MRLVVVEVALHRAIGAAVAPPPRRRRGKNHLFGRQRLALRELAAAEDDEADDERDRVHHHALDAAAVDRLDRAVARQAELVERHQADEEGGDKGEGRAADRPPDAAPHDGEERDERRRPVQRLVRRQVQVEERRRARAVQDVEHRAGGRPLLLAHLHRRLREVLLRRDAAEVAEAAEGHEAVAVRVRLAVRHAVGRHLAAVRLGAHHHLTTAVRVGGQPVVGAGVGIVALVHVPTHDHVGVRRCEEAEEDGLREGDAAASGMGH